MRKGRFGASCSEEVEMTEVAMLAMPQLVHEYNTLAFELGLPEVKRFRSREDGVRRLLEIQERHNHQWVNKTPEEIAQDVDTLLSSLATGNIEEVNAILPFVATYNTEESDVTSIAETIRAAQEKHVDLPENPEEAKAALAEEFEDTQEPSDVEQDAESAAEDQDNPYYADDPEITGEVEVETSATHANEAHAEFGSDDLPPPEEARKKERKPRQAKVAPVGPTKEVDLSSPETIFQAFQVRDGTNKARLIKALINKFDEAEAVDVLVKETYGEEAGKDKVGAMLGGVCLGIQVAIDANNLPFTLKRGKHEEDVFLGLYYTPRQG